MQKFDVNDTPLLLALIYADVYDFPLTAREIFLYSVGKKQAYARILKHLSGITQKKVTGQKDQLFYLSGRSKLTAVRKERYVESFRKWRIGIKLTSILSVIPTIEMIGISGGVAMGNARTDDDIDLFFIVRHGYLWITRMCAVLLTEIFANRRRPGQTEVKDSICLNMFVSDQDMTIPVKDRDLYLAHEIIQLRPVFVKYGIYRRFLKANRWVGRFLPNVWSETGQNLINPAVSGINQSLTRITDPSGIELIFWRIFEPLAKFSQLWYMQKHRTSEQVSDTVLKFHPFDQRRYIRSELAKRCKRLKIPLDKEFFKSIK
jgi:hypothetical protein